VGVKRKVYWLKLSAPRVPTSSPKNEGILDQVTDLLIPEVVLHRGHISSFEI
jgi:hypothetical protein